jgi:putative two-component system response regulator
MVQFSVLLVDDDAPTRAYLEATLEPAGYACLQAESPRVARELIAEHHVDLLICDVDMPGESGFDFVEELSGEPYAPAILMHSGHDDPCLAERALVLGAYGYLVKGGSDAALRIAVRSALYRRELELGERHRRQQLERSARENTRTITQLRNELDQREAVVRHAREDMVLRLARASEARDPESAGHIDRMSRYCELLAEPFGLHPRSVRAASTLHDIGKVAVPDAVLMKPGALSPAERVVMQTHTETGYRLLAGSGSELLEMAATIALTHHERFDGRGYPQGLAGEDIPLEGRVAAVADVFDALTSDRVYRPAFPLAQALAMLRSERGRHFDPRVIDVFFASLEPVKAIHATGVELEAAAPAIAAV